MKNNKRQMGDFKDFEEMVKAHRGVLKSLIDGDGYFRRNEAVEINNGFGKQLSYLKLKLEAYKMLRETPTKEELFLSSKKEVKENRDGNQKK